MGDLTLKVLNKLPKGILEIDSSELHQILSGPTLIHIKGGHEPPIFISVLLHGHEITGFLAVQRFLKRHEGKKLPRSLSLFIGNVEAAHFRRRQNEGHPDLNRVWNEGMLPEHRITKSVMEEMKRKNVFVAVDIHNTSGRNPHYAAVNRHDTRFYYLATHFSRTVVYFILPPGVCSNAFAELAPSVTLECGRPGEPEGTDHVDEFLEKIFHISKIPKHPRSHQEMELYHNIVCIKVPSHLSLGFEKDDADIRFVNDLDLMNFQKIPAESLIAYTKPKSKAHLLVLDEMENDVGEKFFSYKGGEIRNKIPIIPSMLTHDKEIIRMDCVGYLMERIAPK